MVLRAHLIAWLLPVVAVLAGCNASHSNAQKPKPKPPAVTVAKPLKRLVSQEDERVGRFIAIESVEVKARVSGYLDTIHFRDGQIVEKGAALFTIDPRPFATVLEQTRSNLAQAEATLSLATADLTRAKELVMGTSVTQQVMDQRVAAKAAAEANVRAQKAAVRQAELDLSFTELKAPVSGRIGDRRISVGNFVSSATSPSSSTLATIQSIDPIRFEFTLDETTYLKLLRSRSSPGAIEGTPVRLRLIDEASFLHGGRIDFVDNAISRTSGTIRARAEVANPKGLLTPGMFANIRFAVAAPAEALLVPDTAIGTEQVKKFVMVVENNNVPKPKYVKLGRIENGLRVILEGLSPDDDVVIDGLMRIRPGAPVTPNAGAIKAAAASPTSAGN